MKNFKTILYITLMSSLCLTAQNQNTKKADKHFAQYEFIEASEDYKKLVENGKGETYIYEKLAESYYNIFDTVEAEHWYAKALENSQNPEMIYKYSEMLKANGKYDESNEQMDRFASMLPTDYRAIAFKKTPNYLNKILEKEKKFNLKNLEINSEQSDFGGTLYNGKLYITSARNSSRKTYGWNEQPYLDIYSAIKTTDGTYQEMKLLNDDINTKYHEGLVSFNPDGSIMYMTRESFYDRVYEKDSTSKYRKSVIHLFKATKLGDDWDTFESMAINGKEYSIKNPSVSADGKTLYFASDKPGGFGLFDIYKAPINEDGSLGDAVNLGQKINTEGQEMFPFISSNGTIYFSSNGHLGLGSLDVFYAKEIDGNIEQVVNLGVPVNSNADDFAFTINEETEEGFVSSNREGGKGSDDVYAIKRIPPPCDVTLITTVLDNTTREPLTNASVTLFDSEGDTVISKITNNEGIAEFIVKCENNPDIQATIDGYYRKRITVESTNGEITTVQITLDPIEKLIVKDRIELNPIYFDFGKSNITTQAAFELDKLVQIMTKYPDLVVKAYSHTDIRGTASYNKILSDRRAKMTVKYVISKGIDASRISGTGKGENELKVDCGTACTDEDHQLNRRLEFVIISGGPDKK